VERISLVPIGDAVRIESPQGSPESAVLAAAVEAYPESLAIVENGCFLYANSAFARIFGYPASASLQGMPVAQILPATQLFSGIVGPADTAGCRNSGSTSLTAVRKDGTRLRVGLSCASFRAKQEDLLVLGVHECTAPQDSSPSSQMESLGRLAGAVAHDFNNLLTGILLYCDLLQASLQTGDPLRTYVSEIRRAGGHSAELVQQLMAMARPQAERGSHSWHDVISGIQNLLRRLLGENIELRTDSGDGDALVAVEATPMRQIILNLLLNARDAMPQGGRINLEVRGCDECGAPADADGNSCIVLQVTDTGAGMDQATRERLFQPFFTTKGVGKGTGLGLSSVNDIVQRHGGAIHVQTEPGRGTRVCVHLPRARPTPVSQFEPKPKTQVRQQ